MTSGAVRRTLCVLAVLVGALHPDVARADASASDKAAAQVLFDQGKDAARVGRWLDACPKFEESQRLDPTIATQFKLADCFEHVGRTASAWTHFVAVAAATKAAGQSEREQVARERAAALEPKLSRLTIQVGAAERGPALVVKRDGAVVGAALFGVSVPIDPGRHTVTASAPGRRPWEGSVVVLPNGATATLTVPELEIDTTPAAPPPSAPLPADRAESTGSTQRVVGLVVGGVGVAGLAIGTVFGLSAKSTHDDAKTHCRTEALCDAQGLALTDDARASGNVSTVAFVAGGALVVGGVVLFVTAPSGSRSATGRHMASRVGLGSIALEGTW